MGKFGPIPRGSKEREHGKEKDVKQVSRVFEEAFDFGDKTRRKKRSSTRRAKLLGGRSRLGA